MRQIYKHKFYFVFKYSNLILTQLKVKILILIHFLYKIMRFISINIGMIIISQIIKQMISTTTFNLGTKHYTSLSQYNTKI